MDWIAGLSGPLFAFWLAIIGIAIAFGVLHSIGTLLRRGKRDRPG